MSKAIYSVIMVLSTLIVVCGCKKGSSNSGNDNIVRLEFIYDCDTTPNVSSIDLFIYADDDRVIERHTITEPATIINGYTLNVDDGNYTLLTVANLPSELYENITNDKNPLEAINMLQGGYVDLYFGYVETYVTDGVNLKFNMFSDVGLLGFSELMLNIEYPINTMPIYTKSTQPKHLFRTTTEIVRSSDNTTLYRDCSTWSMDSENIATKSIFLHEGNYEVKIWSDYAKNYVDDLYYDTSNMDNIQITTSELYTANSDYRDAYSIYQTATLTEDRTTINVEAYQPLAKYTIVTEDVEKYNQAREIYGYPAIEELNVEVTYEGYLPTGYNISTGRLTSSELGYSYNSRFTEVEDSSSSLAKDFVLVNMDSESSVKLNIKITTDDGDVICNLSSLKVAYQGGCHTMIYANFLTDYNSSGGSSDGGSSDGGLDLDMNWDGEYNFEF